MQVTRAVEQLKPYVAGPRLDEVCREYGVQEMALLHANEYPEGPFPEAREAIVRALAAANRYPDQDCSGLRAELSVRLGVAPNMLVFGNGSCELLKLLGEAFVSEGDHMLYPHPSFVVYTLIGIQRQARAEAVPLVGYGIDVGGIVDRLRADTRLIVVCNPNNPTGSYLGPDTLKSLLRALPGDTLVVLDEAYVEFVTAVDQEDTTAWVHEFSNLVVLRTFSKIYGLAGLRVGYGIAHPAVVEAIDKLRQPYNVSSLAQVAATESLRHPKQLEARRKYIAEERARMAAVLTQQGRPYVPSQANFLFVNIEGLAVPGEEVPRRLLARGVMTRSGYFMGCPGWMRVTIGTVAENDRFLETLASLSGPASA